ncbi:WXG100-like domain-containing protein [Mycolicibacterium sp. Dal123E01]|uniref:WXG100-like domain-containing protein n=1 Tax=Mycolicibacterium sp. Dal123E01 TaxID=3457578 RepID=UPI00403EC8C3
MTAGYNADSGQDAAGTAFGFAYQDSASALVDGVAKGVNALHHLGYLIQGSATNYSRAEAAADISGGAAPLPAPVAPAQYSAPGGDPDVNGPGQTPPVLWYLVEFLVGDWWPNGEPSELRAAAAAWSVFATPLYSVTSGDVGAYATIDAQQMPDTEPMKEAVRDIGTAMSSLGGEAQKLAAELTGFASDVETTQNAIRDLLEKLESVGSVVDHGVMGTVFELITGDAEEKIEEVANDVKAVIANHKRQSAARKDLLAQLVNSIKNHTRAMEIITRVELVNYLGEDAGRIVANISDVVTDFSVGLAGGGIKTVGGIVTGFDPIGDPKGTWAMIEGFGKQVEVFNPTTAPLAFATDPQGSLDMVKSVTHFDDIFTSNRPFLGIGELGFDIGSALIPGGAGLKAAGGARAAEGAAARAELSSAERVAGEAGGIASATTGLRGVSRELEGVTSKLDDLNKTTLDGGKPPPGSPGPLPKSPEPGPRDPGGPPRPGDPLPPPRPADPTPTQGHGAVGPTEQISGDVPGHPGSGSAGVPKVLGESKPSIVDVPATPAERQAMPSPHAEAPASAPYAGSPGDGGSALPSASSAGSMEGAGAHAGEAASSAANGASDRVPVSVGAHGAEGAADGAGHGPHPGAGDGGGGHGGGNDSHGGGGDHGGGGGHGTRGEHGEAPSHEPHDGSTDSKSHDPNAPDSDSADLSPEKHDKLEESVAEPAFYPPGSLPSIEELRGLTNSGPDKAYYWSGRDAGGVGVGPTGSGIAEQMARDADATTLEMSLEKHGVVPLPDWNDYDPESVRFWEDASTAYADNASGVVRAVIGSSLRPGNIWQTVEIPRLMDNPNVTAIIQIDPDTGAETIIFQR